MPFQNNSRNVFKMVFLTLTLLSGLSACSNRSPSEKVEKRNKIELSKEEFKHQLNVVTEQDPKGVFWGLRDTSSKDLILDYTYQKIHDFNNGFATVLLNDKFGLIDTKGKVIVEPAYNYPKTEVKCGYIAFEYGNGPVLIFDTTGKSIMPMIYKMSGFLPCQKRITFSHNQYGMMSLNKDTILPFKFTYAYLIPPGFCVASKPLTADYSNSLYGMYDLNGKQILPHDFKSIGSFSSGRAIVNKNGRYGAINESGRELFYTNYSRIDNYFNNYAVAYNSDEDGVVKIGMIDRNGKEVVPTIYQWLDHPFNFSEGLAAMAINRKYGFVDTTGKTIIPFKYDKVEYFRDGIAKVWKGWRYVGYIDSDGNEIIPVDFESMDQANLRRYFNKFIIGLKDSVYHVFDYSGNNIANLKYQSISVFNEKKKLFVASKNDKRGILDSNFSVIIPFEYESLENIFFNEIAARKNGKIGLIDSKGHLVTPFEYDWVIPFQNDQYQNGLALVGKKDKTGLINSYGNLILPVLYDEIKNFSHGLAVVKNDEKFGFVNDKGHVIIAPAYDEASSFDGYTAEVTLKGETFQIDSSGTRVEEDY